MILPGATLGMLGGGQLGRLYTVAARTMGYEVIVLDPAPDSPAGRLATRHLRAAYDDPAALDELAKNCAAVSIEFENVPAASLEALARRCVVHPSASAVLTTQDRIREKRFLCDAGFPTPAFAAIRTEQDLERGLRDVGTPALLKVSRHGYDGKGQAAVDGIEAARRAWESTRREPCVLEARVPLDTEISVVLARGADGAVAAFPVAQNTHRDGILDVTVVPADVPPTLAHEADLMARGVAEKLGYVGVMAVEFFVARGKLLVNEIAPRPHNSGHYTLDACVTSQFDQQVRALCGLPLGDTRLLSPAVMVNLLGDLWRQGSAPAWNAVLSHPNARLHLYGKREPRPGRKMGHYTVLGRDRDELVRLARRIQEQLQGVAARRHDSKAS